MTHLFKFTHHALEQCASRYDKHFNHDDAKLLLEEAIEEAIYKLPEPTRRGETQWHLPTVGLVMITKVREHINLVVTVVEESHVRSVEDQRRIARMAEDPREEHSINEQFVETQTLRLEIEVDWRHISTKVTRKKAEEQLQELVNSNLKSLVKGLTTHKNLRVDATRMYKVSDIE